MLVSTEMNEMIAKLEKDLHVSDTQKNLEEQFHLNTGTLNV